MNLRRLLGILGATASAAGLAIYARYLKDIRAVRSTVESGSSIAETELGSIEYGEAGEGKPLLLIHGAGGGYDQGLLIGRDFGEGYRVIAPSRFGYLRTPILDNASQAAQARAHVALLDRLGIERAIVVGVSAGGPSAIELALQFPERVSALILLVPLTYEPSNQIGVDAAFESQVVLQLVERSADFLFWLAIKYVRASVVRFLGVPPALETKASDKDRARVTEVMRSILPLSRRVRGINVDSSMALEPCTQRLSLAAAL